MASANGTGHVTGDQSDDFQCFSSFTGHVTFKGSTDGDKIVRGANIVPIVLPVTSEDDTRISRMGHVTCRK